MCVKEKAVRQCSRSGTQQKKREVPIAQRDSSSLVPMPTPKSGRGSGEMVNIGLCSWNVIGVVSTFR